MQKESGENERPAGFWIRVLASLIDSIVFIPLAALSFYNLLSLKSVLLMLAISLPGFLYKPFMESRYGATLGKMWLGIKVTDENGQNLSLSYAYIRFLPFLSSSIVALVSSYGLYMLPEFEVASALKDIAPLQEGDPMQHLQSIFSVVIMIDCVAVAFTYRNRALHDMMAHSYCVYK